MAELAFLPLATDAWVADTSHLSRVERAIYMDLLILMWRTPECRVPNDLAWVARKLNCDADESKTLAAIVAEFCKTSGNWLTQKRLRKEFDYCLEKRKKQSDRAKSRWNKDKDTSHGNAAPHVSGNAPTLSPTPTLIPLDKSNGVQASIDPTKVMFDAGVGLLGSSGVAAGKARSLLGKWRRDNGDEAVMAALGKAKREGAIDPVAFVEGCFRAKRRDGISQHASIHETAPAL